MQPCCSHCGAENNEGDTYCGECGRALMHTAVATAATPLAPSGPAPRRLASSPAIRALPTHPLPIEAPKYIGVLGWINILMGGLLPAASYLVVHYADVEVLQAQGFSDDVLTPFVVTNWMNFGLGLLLILTGIGLVQKARWGRVLAIVWVGFAFLSVCVAGACASVALALAKLEWERTHSFGSIQIKVWWFAPFSPAYGVMLLTMMIIPPTRRWVRGVRAERRGLPLDQASPATNEPPVSALALTSMILSMTPFLLLTQIAGLVTGIMALRRIRRSKGQLGGRGYALTGVIISSLILSCFGGLIGLGLIGTFVIEPMERAKREEQRQHEPKRVGSWKAAEATRPLAAACRSRLADNRAAQIKFTNSSHFA